LPLITAPGLSVRAIKAGYEFAYDLAQVVPKFSVGSYVSLVSADKVLGSLDKGARGNLSRPRIVLNRKPLINLISRGDNPTVYIASFAANEPTGTLDHEVGKKSQDLASGCIEYRYEVEDGVTGEVNTCMERELRAALPPLEVEGAAVSKVSF
jgi:hypothetical protein